MRESKANAAIQSNCHSERSEESGRHVCKILRHVVPQVDNKEWVAFPAFARTGLLDSLQ